MENSANQPKKGRPRKETQSQKPAVVDSVTDGPEERLYERWCELNAWEWPEDVKKPKDWVDGRRNDQLVHMAMRDIRLHLGGDRIVTKLYEFDLERKRAALVERTGQRV